MHTEVAEWIQYAIDTHGPFEAVIEVGSLDVNGSVRPQFERAGARRYHGVDVQDGRGVDEVIDFADRVHDGLGWDCVVCTEALEHTPRGPEVVANAFMHLAPGGWFVATMAGPGRGPHSGSPIEGPPGPDEWYENVTSEALRVWLDDAGFVDVELNSVRSGVDLRCVARRPR